MEHLISKKKRVFRELNHRKIVSEHPFGVFFISKTTRIRRNFHACNECTHTQTDVFLARSGTPPRQEPRRFTSLTPNFYALTVFLSERGGVLVDLTDSATHSRNFPVVRNSLRHANARKTFSSKSCIACLLHKLICPSITLRVRLSLDLN